MLKHAELWQFWFNFDNLDTQHSFSFKADTKFRALHYNFDLLGITNNFLH